MSDKLLYEPLFDKIALDLHRDGFSINEQALPLTVTSALVGHIHTLNDAAYKKAGIGRLNEHELNTTIRKDKIAWITSNTEVGQLWLSWAAALQVSLNRQLFLGLFSFESHFAYYGKGAFYKRHMDAFRGDTNRVVSVVVYLNEFWKPTDGGELVLYRNEQDQSGIVIAPTLGTVLVFLSEEFPHEVLPTQTDRHSIAGWFRVNTSTAQKLDPPQ